MRNVFMALAVAAIAGSATTPGLAQGKPLRTISDGIIDEAKLYSEKLPAVTIVLIRPFSATDDDLVEGDKSKEETKKMQGEAPKLLAERFAAELKKRGPFTDVTILEGDAAPTAGALVVEGKFTEMDPGSRAKRYLVGFGAGKSGVTVQGSVKSTDGTLLATFQQRRVGVMGVAGGDSMDKLKDDTKNIGEDLAKFLSEWGKGKKLE